MKTPYDVIVEPYITEKTTELKEQQNQVVFKVALHANKIEIRKAVEALFNVKVADINVVRMNGKMKRVRYKLGRRPDWKKALITLAPGYKIDFFEGV